MSLTLLGVSKFNVAGGFFRPITVQSSEVTGTHTDYPVLVHFFDPTLATVANGGKVRNADGYDITFWDDSTKTSAKVWEMEQYNPVTGEGWAWILLPSLTNSADVTMAMTYGDPTIGSFQSTPTAVWDSSYKLVDHMTNLTLDSTSGAFALTNQNTATVVSGKIGGSGNFVNASSQRVVGNAAALVSTVTDNFTLSCWLFSANAAPALHIAVSLSDDLGGYQIGRGENGGVPDYKIMGLYGGVTWVPSASYFPDSAWVNITLRRNAGTTQVYVNGVASGSSIGNTPNIPQSSGGNRAVSIGCQYQLGSPGRHWEGGIDEVRFSETVRSTDRITTEHRNQNAPDTFAVVGSESPL